MSFITKNGGWLRGVSRSLAVIALFLLMVPLSAEETPASLTLTVEDAVQRAVEGNISLKQSAITLNAAKRSSQYSWNGVSPSLSVSGSYAKPNASDTGTVSIRGSVSISLSPSLYTTIQSAKLNYEKGELDYTSAVRTIEKNVRTSYYSLLYEQENSALLERNVASAKQQYEANLAKYNSGVLSQLDVLSTQVTYQNSQLSLDSAKVTWENDIATFKQLLGIPLTTNVTLKGSLEDILSVPDITLAGVEQKSATITSIEKQIEIAETSLTATKFSAYGPSLSASWSYAPSASTSDMSTWKDGGSLSVGASIPLDGWLPWSSSALNIASKKDTIETLKLQLEDAKTTFAASTQNSLRKVTQSKARIAQRKASIDLAQKTYDMTLTAYNHGTKDLLSLQSASDSLFSAKVNLKSEAYTLASAILDLENTIGVPFGTLSKQGNTK